MVIVHISAGLVDHWGKYAFLLESTMNEFYNQRKLCCTAGGRAEWTLSVINYAWWSQSSDERVLQPAQAVQHDARRRTARLEGLRHRHAFRFTAQVYAPPQPVA